MIRKFVEQLTQKQVEAFFRKQGYLGNVIWTPDVRCIILKTPGTNEKPKNVFVTDLNILNVNDYEITEGDWQVYLRSIFGY